jgi:hypothetical protein
MKPVTLLASLALAGCSAFPRDADGTSDRIAAERVFRVGLVATGGADPTQAAAHAFVARVARATGARPRLRSGASEELLVDLDKGRLDLVVGVLAPETPWVSEVAILQPIAVRAAPERLVLTPVARNGENRWIMLLEREAQAIAPGLEP